jgi:hypothetical protein
MSCANIICFDELPEEPDRKVIFRWKPQQIAPGLLNLGDIPEEYAVIELPNVGRTLYGGCIIYGKYHGKWHANVSARSLVDRLIAERTRLIESLSSLKAAIEEKGIAYMVPKPIETAAWTLAATENP